MATGPQYPVHSINIRQAVSSDLPSLANLASEVFFKAPIDLQFFPRHVLHPAQHRAFFLREFKLRLASPNQIVIVAEVNNVTPSKPKENLQSQTKPNEGAVTKLKGHVKNEAEYLGLKKETERAVGEGDGDGSWRINENDGGRYHIIAYAAWMRFGPLSQNSSKNLWPCDSPYKALSRLLLHASGFLSLLTSHSHSVRAMRSFHLQAMSIISSLQLESWVDLSALAVKPGWQRRGIGGQLVDWGLAEADKEGIACVLEATGDGVRLYEKRGFRIVGEVSLKARDVVVKRRNLLVNKKGEVLSVREVRMPLLFREAKIHEVRDGA